MTDSQTIIETLRQRGYRVTPQREMVIDALAISGRHMTADDVFYQVRQRTSAVNIATVYRTLDMLVEEGLASRADLRSGQVVYAAVQHGPHVHLVCRQCGLVIEAPADLFEPAIRDAEERYGFACGPHHFAIYGLCADCQAAEQMLKEE